MDAAAGEHHHQHRHQNRSDQEERTNRNLHGGEAEEQEDADKHHRGGQTTDPHTASISAHRVDGLVEDHGFSAFTEHGEEAQHSQRDHGFQRHVVGTCGGFGISHSSLGLLANVTVPRFHAGLVQHPVTRPQQHAHGDQCAGAFHDLLNRAGAAEGEHEDHSHQAGAEQTDEHTQVNPLDEALVIGLDQVGDDGCNHQQSFKTLTDKHEERLAGGAGDQLGETVFLIGGTTVKNAGVLDQHGLEVVDQLLGVFQGCAGVHGLAAHLELVFHLRDAVAADGVHHVLFEAELLVILVVRVVHERGALGTITLFVSFVCIVENRGHFVGHVGP